MAVARPQNGWLVFESPDGAVVYAVPSDMIAYALDVSYGQAAEITSSLSALRDMGLLKARPHGEA